MEYTIRPYKLSDAKEYCEMRRMDGVINFTTAIPSEPEENGLKFLESLGPDDHLFTAETQTESGSVMIGSCGLYVCRKARLRHCGVLAIMVRTEYQNQGVGHALMERILDLADNWLLLKRVELETSAENARAIHLYESFSFVREGVKKYAIVTCGELRNIVMMARYRNI
jgi:putative acetyltransferase